MYPVFSRFDRHIFCDMMMEANGAGETIQEAWRGAAVLLD